MHRVKQLSSWTKLNVAGLVLTAAGMLLQIAAGSNLYPSVTGPVVLLAAAVFVALGPRGWTPWVGLIVPLVLGLGAIAAAVMTGEFTAQLATIGEPAILLGSWMHVLGLTSAVAGGVGALLNRRGVMGVER